MTKLANQAGQIAQQAMATLRQGNASNARALFQQASTINAEDTAIWLGLAFACAQLDDSPATLSAVNKALELEPYNMRALLFKGDHLMHQQQSRKALVYYKAALKLAAGQSSIPADVQTALRRAEASCKKFAGQYEDYLLQSLQKAGYNPAQSHPRFNQALDIAFGKADIYYQQPTRFYYPGLPQIQFYPRQQFPWLEQLEANTEAIRTELDGVLQQADRFSPYLQSDPDIVNFNDVTNLDNDDWSAFYFYQAGHEVRENAALCPATMAALASAPLPQVEGSTPHALFSKLAGNTRIPPHHGLINTRLICHLPLLVPKDCGGLRVGNQTQHWQEGEAYIFDDSIEHEAWNDSDQERVVLLFDIWRPELDEEERHLIGSMLRAVQSYEDE